MIKGPILVHGDKMAEARRRYERHKDSFAEPGGHSANLEAWRSFLRGL